MLARPAPSSFSVDVKRHVPENANVTKQISIAQYCDFAKARAVTMTLEQLLLPYCFNAWSVNDIV